MLLHLHTNKAINAYNWQMVDLHVHSLQPTNCIHSSTIDTLFQLFKSIRELEKKMFFSWDHENHRKYGISTKKLKCNFLIYNLYSSAYRDMHGPIYGPTHRHTREKAALPESGSPDFGFSACCCCCCCSRHCFLLLSPIFTAQTTTPIATPTQISGTTTGRKINTY